MENVLTEHATQASRRQILFSAAATVDDGIVVVRFVYILRCSDKSLYIGETNDISSRVAKHNEGPAL
jgi:hypothetical protein